MNNESSSRALRFALLALTAAVLACACGQRGPFTTAASSPDYAQFEKGVYPVLLRDCAFSAQCHGSTDRFFQVYGPGRTRLDPKTMPDDPATPDEILRSYERSVSMLMSGSTVESSLLLSKPLETNQGGQAHKGIDVFGRNVFTTAKDPSYVVLLKWAKTKGVGPSAMGGAQP